MPRLGEALKAIVGEGEETVGVKGRPESILMNPTRQIIFEHLCHRPASRLRPISRKLGISATVVQFHLRKMLQHQYVSAKEVDGSAAYYPSDLKASLEDVAAMALLADDDARSALKLAVEKPGLTSAELAPEIGRSVVAVRGILKSLEEQGLVAIVIDGRHNRVFPGDGLLRLDKRTRQLLRGMKGRLMKRLARDHLNPQIEMDARREGTISLHFGGKINRLRLPSEGLVPWMSSR